MTSDKWIPSSFIIQSFIDIFVCLFCKFIKITEFNFYKLVVQ